MSFPYFKLLIVEPFLRQTVQAHIPLLARGQHFLGHARFLLGLCRAQLFGALRFEDERTLELVADLATVATRQSGLKELQDELRLIDETVPF